MSDTELPTTTLGRTGLQVTRLGYGAMELHRARPESRRLKPEQAGEVLNAVLDAGINFIDTSPCYGASEEMIGRYIAHRRSEYFLATKCGCPVAVPQEPTEGGRMRHVFTRENVVAAVEQSLRRMNTDYLDIVQFHASPAQTGLEEEDGLEALRELQAAGNVRFIGMSGTLPHLPESIAMGIFDEFQIPYSALQREHEELISRAASAGAGTVIRGGAARGAPSEEKDWTVPAVYGVPEATPRTLWERARVDDLLDGASRQEFVLRFTLSHPDMHTTIVGTSNVEHLRQNVEAARKGPLPADVYAEAKRRLDQVGN